MLSRGVETDGLERESGGSVPELLFHKAASRHVDLDCMASVTGDVEGCYCAEVRAECLGQRGIDQA